MIHGLLAFVGLTFGALPAYGFLEPSHKQIAVEIARAQNIEPKLVLAIIKVESSGNPKAKGALDEIGLMQLRKKYFPTVTFNVKHNVHLGTSYLAKLKRLKQRDWGRAWFVAYNYGPNAQLKDPITTEYYRRVRKAMDVISIR